MKAKLLYYFLIPACLVALLVTAGCGGKNGGSGSASEAATAKFHCPMHPTYTSDRPADCPICGMKLVPIKGASSEGGSAEGEHAAVPGRTTIQIDPVKRQTIGLHSVPVDERPLSRTIRTTGVVQHDETKLVRITPRFGGFVRKLFVNFTGQPVNKGQPLFTVYSPEVFSTEREYLLALNNLKQLKSDAAPDQKQSAERLLNAARKRLELWQIGEQEIEVLETRGAPSDEIVFRSPVSGHVLSKNAVEGRGFMAGEALYEIADLSQVWVRASIYEYELPDVRVGQKARLTFLNVPGKVYESEVTFIYPHIDPQTRRAELRLELNNPEHQLKPDMWANVELEIDLGNVLSVPAGAIIDTGTRCIAFVEAEKNHLEPREVKIGVRTDDYWQVLEGLKEGERVVSRALFLVDSESQLKAAIAGMGAGGEHKH